VVHHVAARNVRRVGDVDKTRPGLFLFNYFAGADPALAAELWDYPAGWYEAETGLDNSTLLAPLEGEQSDYVLINRAAGTAACRCSSPASCPRRVSAATCWPT
jgi:hypothetical protein